MKAIADIIELEKIVRKYLISQSEVKSEYVRNSLSTYGETLDKLLFKQTYDTICECDELILFELQTRKSESDVSMTEADDSVTIYKSYTVHVIIYGRNSATVMTKLIARLRTENVRLALRSEGVYVEEVTNDESVNEFKNDVMWHRHDCEVRISCYMSVSQTLKNVEFEDTYGQQEGIIIKEINAYE